MTRKGKGKCSAIQKLIKSAWSVTRIKQKKMKREKQKKNQSAIKSGNGHKNQ